MRRWTFFVCLLLAACSKPAPPAGPTAPVAVSPAPLKSPAQGQENWAVFAYVGAPGEGAEAAKQALGGKGLEFGIDFFEGELGCNDGAPQALALPGESMAISVHFATEAEAQAFAATLASPPTGIAKVTQMCAD